MMFPKKVKYRKWQTGRKNPDKLFVPAPRGTTMAFGSYGMKAETSARVNSQQIEAARRALSRAIGKTGKVWIRIFPDRPYTAKAAEVGMGKGKGDLKGYVFEVHPGRVLFEVDGVTEEAARKGMHTAGAKLPLKTRFVSRER